MLSDPAKISLISVLVFLVLLILCCAGCGTFMICAYQVNRASKQIGEIQTTHAKRQEEKRQGQANASESIIEVD